MRHVTVRVQTSLIHTSDFAKLMVSLKVSHKAQIFSIHKIMLIVYTNPVNIDTA